MGETRIFDAEFFEMTVCSKNDGFENSSIFLRSLLTSKNQPTKVGKKRLMYVESEIQDHLISAMSPAKQLNVRSVR